MRRLSIWLTRYERLLIEGFGTRGEQHTGLLLAHTAVASGFLHFGAACGSGIIGALRSRRYPGGQQPQFRDTVDRLPAAIGWQLVQRLLATVPLLAISIEPARSVGELLRLRLTPIT